MTLITAFSKISNSINVERLKVIMLEFEKNLDFNLTWGQNGIDSLDLVELIMIMENEFQITIPDITFRNEKSNFNTSIDNTKPIDFINSINYYNRDEKLNYLLK